MVLGLLDAGEQPVVIDDMSNGVPWAIPQGVPFVRGDSGDYETVARVIATHKVDAVIHFAARLIIPQFYDDPLELWRPFAPDATGRAVEGASHFLVEDAPGEVAADLAGFLTAA